MSVRRYDNPLRFFVTSHSRAKVEHLVELDAYDGNGACACEHFYWTLGPIVKTGVVPSNETRCHHILEAREAFADNVIKLIVANKLPEVDGP